MKIALPLLTGCMIVLLTAMVFAEVLPLDASPGQKIEVREGDTWSSAEVLKKEGRKVQIRYEDGTEEWVTADRLRMAGSTEESQKNATTEKAGATTKPNDASKPAWRVGQLVDVADGAQWWAAKVESKKGDDYEVSFDGWGSRKQTVSASNLRPRTKGKKGPSPIEPDDQWMDRVCAKQAKIVGASGNPFGAEAEDPTRPLTEPKGSAATIIDLNRPTSGAWKLALDPVVKAPPALKAPISLKSKSQGPPAGITLEVTSTAAFVGRQTGSGAADKTITVERVNLANSSSKVFEMTTGYKLVSASPDGRHILLQRDGFQGGTKNRIDVWNVEGDVAKYVAGFMPCSDGGSGHADIAWAAMLDSDHVLTLGGRDTELTCWELPACTAKWTAKLPWWTTPALSPGGKQIAIATNDRLVVLDAATGRVLASAANPAGIGTLAFRSDGAMLASISGDNLAIWDLGKGELVSEILAPAGLWKRLLWADDNYLLANGDLISTKSRTVVWKYKVPDQEASQAAGDRVWYVGGENALHAVQLPHDDARRAAEAAKDDFLVGPGSAVSLEINIADPAVAKQVSEGLTAALAKRQITVADGESVKVIASITPGKTSERSYRIIHFGPGGGGPSQVTKSITEQIHKVAVVAVGSKDASGSAPRRPPQHRKDPTDDGKDHEAWSRVGVFGEPSLGSMKEGESMDSRIAEAAKPNVAFFSGIRFPALIPQPVAPALIGQSLLPD